MVGGFFLLFVLFELVEESSVSGTLVEEKGQLTAVSASLTQQVFTPVSGSRVLIGKNQMVEISINTTLVCISFEKAILKTSNRLEAPGISRQ